MSSEEYEKLKTRLYSKSIKIKGKFGDMFNEFFKSLREREISIKRVVANLKVFGIYPQVYKGENPPLLREELKRLDLAKTNIDDIQLIVLDFCSFFNFKLLIHLIKSLGISQDKEKLEQYENEFNEYAQRRVSECPSEVAEPSDTSQASVIIKLDDHYEDCTLNQLRLLETDFCEILNITSVKLCHITEGCLQLTFQLPWFVKQEIFPLSEEKKEKLTALHVIRITCGHHWTSLLLRSSKRAD